MDTANKCTGFSPVIDWLEGVYIDANIFRTEQSKETIMAETEAMKNELVEKTLMFKAEPIEVTRCLKENPAFEDLKLNTDRWWLNEERIKTVFDQFVKMKIAVAMNTA